MGKGRVKSCGSEEVPSMSSSFSTRAATEEGARLSFVSSSTGYSSARSSLRSSCEESSDVPLSGHKQSAERRLELLRQGGSLSQLDRICIELLDTERVFVCDIYHVIQGYLNFMITHREELSVTVDQVSTTFGCIERIFNLNKSLYAQLDAAQLDPVRMCQVFIDNADRFEDYVTYCTNYQRMISSLCVLSSRTCVSNALRQQQSALGHSLPLSAYLLKPVQRILKYHLFIENMLKELTAAGADENSLKVVRKALQDMTGQASRMNDEKKRSEHVERVAQLQRGLQDWGRQQAASDLSAYGDLLLESPFRLAGSKTMRQLFLFEEMLLIAKQRGTQLIAKDFIMCSNLMLNESVTSDPLAFQVLSFDCPRAQYLFLASSTDHKRLWMRELKRAVLDHFELAIPEETKRLMLSMDCTQPKISFGRPEFAEVNTKTAKKIPKYLERRRKSVDAKERRRSLSTSRLAHSTSQVSMRLALDSEPPLEIPKCTCRQPSTPTVSRALSTSTMDFGTICSPSSSNEKQNLVSAPFSFFTRKKSEKDNGRGRFFQARRQRQLPPTGGREDECCERAEDGSLPQSLSAPNPHAQPLSNSYHTGKDHRGSHPGDSRVMLNEQIERTFDEIYRNLQMFGAEQEKALLRQLLPDRADASRRLDDLVKGKHEEKEIELRHRSKSLTRLDEGFPSKSLTRLDEIFPSGTCPLESELERQRRLERYEKVGGWEPTERQNCIRRSRHAPSPLTRLEGLGSVADEVNRENESSIHSPLQMRHPVFQTESTAPPSRVSKRSCARQRAPLSIEQCRALDSLQNDCGVVREMIAHIENSPNAPVLS